MPLITTLPRVNGGKSTLGSLLAGVSHELNNPLAIVVGEATLLEEDAELDPPRLVEPELTADRLDLFLRGDLPGQDLGRIAAEPTIPESLKVRAAQMASSLGVQPETAALPTPEDTE